MDVCGQFGQNILIIHFFVLFGEPGGLITNFSNYLGEYSVSMTDRNGGQHYENMIKIYSVDRSR